MPTLGLPLDSHFCLGPPLRFRCWRSSPVLGFSKPFCFHSIFPLYPKDAKSTSLLFDFHIGHRDLLFQKLLPFRKITVTHFFRQFPRNGRVLLCKLLKHHFKMDTPQRQGFPAVVTYIRMELYTYQRPVHLIHREHPFLISEF